MANLPAEIQEFIEKYKPLQLDDEDAFILFCKEAVELAKKYPKDRSEIAYTIVGKGAVFGESKKKPISEIRNYAMDLELPDHHIYVGDGMSIEDKWLTIESYVEDGLFDIEQRKSKKARSYF
jgi:hypothetical protein